MKNIRSKLALMGNRILRKVLRFTIIKRVENESSATWQISNSEWFKQPRSCQIVGLSRIYEGFFGRATGSFVEVGAYDGFTYSNTFGLLKRGWSGHLIEPNPNLHRVLLDNLSETKSTLYGYGIGADPGESDFFSLGPYSSFDHDFLRSIENSDWYREEFKFEVTRAQIKTAKDFFNEAQLNQFDLLVVDVEGMNLEVLVEIIEASAIPPRMVICEISENNGERILDYLCRKREYICIYKDEINCVCVQQILDK